MDHSTDLADHYVAVWNESDAVRRRAAIAQLWVPGGEHFVRTLRAVGYEELERRVTGSHEKNVRDAGYRFRRAGAAQRLHDSVMFHWEMFRPGHERAEALGLQFLRLAADGRIATDYQFILPAPAAA